MSLHRSFRKGGTRLAALAAAALLSGCLSDGDVATKDPSFYRSMAVSGAQVDAATAASMISGYRKNNGLPPVTVDPELMKLAQAQAQGMASNDKLSHDIIRSFHDRLKGGGYRAYTAAENGGAGYHTPPETIPRRPDSAPHPP